MGIDWPAVVKAAPTPAPTPTPAAPTAAPAIHAQLVSSAAPEVPRASDIIGKVESGVAKLFQGLKGLSNDRTEFGGQTQGSGYDIGKSGNIGSPQGSNIIKVDSRNGWEYTNDFINTSGEDMTIVVWNKAFDQGNGIEANLGSAIAPKSPILTFALAPGEHQIVAFQEDTQIGWAQATTKKKASGAFDTAWGEANFHNGGSGYDLSAIMNSAGNTYDMAISSTQTPCISDMTQNYWYAFNNDENDPRPVGTSDGSCYIPPGNGATLTTKMGGQL